MAQLAKTRSDLVTGKTIFLNGEKLGGVQGCNIDFNITGDLLSKVTLILAIKRGSLQFSRKGNWRIVSFETTSNQEEIQEGFPLVYLPEVEELKTVVDHSQHTTIVMNGKKLKGLKDFSIVFNGDTSLRVHLELFLKQGGIEIVKKRTSPEFAYRHDVKIETE